ncbi:MAG TPA: SCP2 sterol-binding domain-containing protein [Saprospiraceae bacterium]|nr:SCP2 sterol-binding domain-containing protein [Saprospiraceae bacterium]
MRSATGEPSCTVRANTETLTKLLSRDLNPMMAMMTGKLKISNPGEMLKYAKIFGLM